jgi:hypothetical protein
VWVAESRMYGRGDGGGCENACFGAIGVCVWRRPTIFFENREKLPDLHKRIPHATCGRRNGNTRIHALVRRLGRRSEEGDDVR